MATEIIAEPAVPQVVVTREFAAPTSPIKTPVTLGRCVVRLPEGGRSGVAGIRP